MPNFSKNRAGQQVGKTLGFRSRRANSGQVHSVWKGVDVNPPTSLSAVPSTTSVAISFTAPSGDTPTNFLYALSTNGGSSYGAFTALSPADATSPITIGSLTANTAYFVKLKTDASGELSDESVALSFSTLKEAPTSFEYLVIAGGGAGGSGTGAGGTGGGGAGGYRTSVSGATSGGGASAEGALSVSGGSSYTVTVGAGAGPVTGDSGNKGSDSVLATITSTGGGGGVKSSTTNRNGGSGGGGSQFTGGGTGTASQGYNGGSGGGVQGGSGGGGAGAVGTNATGNPGGAGGAGVSNSITGSAVTRGGGGGGGAHPDGGAGGSGGSGGGGAGASGGDTQGAGGSGSANTGGGGGGSRGTGGSGGSGVVIIRYSDSKADLTTIGAGLTYSKSSSGGYTIYTFTAGTGTITV